MASFSNGLTVTNSYLFTGAAGSYGASTLYTVPAGRFAIISVSHDTSIAAGGMNPPSFASGIHLAAGATVTRGTPSTNGYAVNIIEFAAGG